MKIVVAAYGSRGDVEPAIAVGAELLRRGHDVCMAATVPPEMRVYVESAGLVSVPYGRDWRELLGDEDFTRMLQNPVSTIPQAVEYVAQVVAEKNTTLVSLTDDADLLVAGMTEQVPSANVAEYRRIPLAALHFFPSQILQPGSPQGGATTHADRAQRQALGLPDEPRAGERPLEIQAYERLCVPALAAQWAAEDDRRPFVGALTLQLPTHTDDEVLSWTAAGPPPVYFGFGSTPVAAPAETVAVIGAACSRGIGNRGGVEFFTQTEGAGSPDTAAAMGIYDSDMKFAAFLLQEQARLLKLYGSGLPRDEILKRRVAVFAAINSDYAELKPTLSGLERFDLDKTPLNNAVLLNYLIYFHELDNFAKLFALNHNDLRATIKQIIALAQSQPNDPFFAIWQATHDASQGGGILPPVPLPSTAPASFATRSGHP